MWGRLAQQGQPGRRVEGLHGVSERGEGLSNVAAFEWLGPQDAQALSEEVRQAFTGDVYAPGLLWSTPLWEACGARVEGMRVLARGAEVPEANGATHRPLLVLDRDAQRVWFAPSQLVPPVLWIDVGPTVEHALEAMTGYLPRRRTARHAFPRIVRAYGGAPSTLWVPSPYSGALEPAFTHELNRHWVMSPLVESWYWGSSQTDDPWPDAIPAQPARELEVLHVQQEVLQQEPGGVCAVSRRTQLSCPSNARRWQTGQGRPPSSVKETG